jgi:hypothetical protein
MVWRKIGEPIELGYVGLDRFLGIEVEERPRTVVIAVGRGTAFCGRPIYRHTYYLKGRKIGGGRALVTHWSFEEGPAPMGPSTLGFGIFFPEMIESAYRRTPIEEQEEGLQSITEELEDLSRGQSWAEKA